MPAFVPNRYPATARASDLQNHAAFRQGSRLAGAAAPGNNTKEVFRSGGGAALVATTGRLGQTDAATRPDCAR